MNVPGSVLLQGFTLLVALGSIEALAADAEGNYAIWGLGQTSCNQFVKAAADNDLAEYKHFVAGYLTAINRLTPAVYRATGPRTMQDNLKVLKDYCLQNRMDSVDQALLGLLKTTASASTQGGAAWGRMSPDK
jgi:hypothetical protein